jgi:hypothetical protein
MAKGAKETLTKTHKFQVEGTVDMENMLIENEELGKFNMKDILQKFNGNYVTLTITEKDEEEL